MMDPIHQFNIEKIFTIGHIGGQEIAFTNSSAYMLVAVVLTSLLMLATGRKLVPGRMQSIAEISYEFVADTIRTTAGKDGMKFFPFVFSIFMLVTVSNLVGIIPYTFTISSHIIVTAALAFLVFFTVLIYGFYRNGLRFFKLFVPSGIPIVILPLVVAIEVISFLSRPVSHSVRLFEQTHAVRDRARQERDHLDCHYQRQYHDRNARRHEQFEEPQAVLVKAVDQHGEEDEECQRGRDDDVARDREGI